MIESNLSLTRRKLIFVTPSLIASTLLLNSAGKESEAMVVETKQTGNNIDSTNPECKGCQVCRIYYSNCLALNNRLCWCQPVGPDLSVAQK